MAMAMAMALAMALALAMAMAMAMALALAMALAKIYTQMKGTKKSKIFGSSLRGNAKGNREMSGLSG